MYINTITNSTINIYHTEDFMAFLEQHLTHIKKQGYTLVNITPTNAYKHEGNFYGILNELTIPTQFHFITMRINDLRNSNEYDGIITEIKLPNFDIMEQLKNQYLTLKK